MEEHNVRNVTSEPSQSSGAFCPFRLYSNIYFWIYPQSVY